MSYRAPTASSMQRQQPPANVHAKMTKIYDQLLQARDELNEEKVVSQDLQNFNVKNYNILTDQIEKLESHMGALFDKLLEKQRKETQVISMDLQNRVQQLKQQSFEINQQFEQVQKVQIGNQQDIDNHQKDVSYQGLSVMKDLAMLKSDLHNQQEMKQQLLRRFQQTQQFLSDEAADIGQQFETNRKQLNLVQDNSQRNSQKQQIIQDELDQLYRYQQQVQMQNLEQITKQEYMNNEIREKINGNLDSTMQQLQDLSNNFQHVESSAVQINEKQQNLYTQVNQISRNLQNSNNSRSLQLQNLQSDLAKVETRTNDQLGLRDSQFKEDLSSNLQSLNLQVVRGTDSFRQRLDSMSYSNHHNLQRAEENIENLHRNWAIKGEQIERAIEMIRRRIAGNY